MRNSNKKLESKKYESPWKKWCRLCGAPKAVFVTRMEDMETSLNEDRGNQNFVEIQELFNIYEDTQVAESLERFFGIKEEHPEDKPQNCCRRCMQLLKNIQRYAGHVANVQDMYAELWALEVKGQAHNWEDALEKFDFIHGTTEDNLEYRTRLRSQDIKNEMDVNICQELDDLEACFTDIKHDTQTTDDEDYAEDALREDTDVEAADDDSQTDSEATEPSTRNRRSKCKKNTVRSKCIANRSAKNSQHICQHCARGYKAFSHYRRHMRLQHKQDIPFAHACTHCALTFSTALQLKAHNAKHLPLELKQRFGCVYCEKKFTTVYVLRNHISTVHLNETSYICEECGTAVKSSSSLKSHMLTHSDERPFKCEHCEKSFKNKPALKRHRQKHSLFKPVCTVCGLQLSSRASLNRHMLIHSNVKNYKCDFCQQEFKRAEAYKNHLLLHTGLKPYACNFCDRTFANGSNCRSHLKKAHPQELAAFEQEEGKVAAFTNTLPKLEQLKAITKNSNNIYRVNSKNKRSAVKESSEDQPEEVNPVDILECRHTF